jgi:hypothetical protein
LGHSKPRSAHSGRLHEPPEAPTLEPGPPLKGRETLIATHFFNDIRQEQTLATSRPSDREAVRFGHRAKVPRSRVWEAGRW